MKLQSQPSKFILSRKPKEYLKQGISHRGEYAVKGILSAYGLDIKSHPKEYHLNWTGTVTGTTLGPHYLIKILRKNGIDAIRKTAEDFSFLTRFLTRRVD